MTDSPLHAISVIIPTFNEANQIEGTLTAVRGACDPVHLAEIIVVDGGSTDETITIASEQGAKILQSGKGRSRQMNAGASVATGDILYFLHADTAPPSNFDRLILDTVAAGYGAGSCRLRFDYAHPMLRLTEFIVNHLPNTRMGDQSLFVTQKVFEQIEGFDESLVIMEDADIVRRIKRVARFRRLPAAITTSARKFHENGMFRLAMIFSTIFILYELGASHDWLLRFYRRSIRQDKI